MAHNAKATASSTICLALLLLCNGGGCATWCHLETHCPLVTRLFPACDSMPSSGHVCVADSEFYGYHPTCWRPWPEGWEGCPPCDTECGAEIKVIGEVKEAPASEKDDSGEDSPEVAVPDSVPIEPAPPGPNSPAPKVLPLPVESADQGVDKPAPPSEKDDNGEDAPDVVVPDSVPIEPAPPAPNPPAPKALPPVESADEGVDEAAPPGKNQKGAGSSPFHVEELPSVEDGAELPPKTDGEEPSEDEGQPPEPATANDSKTQPNSVTIRLRLESSPEPEPTALNWSTIPESNLGDQWSGDGGGERLAVLEAPAAPTSPPARCRLVIRVGGPTATPTSPGVDVGLERGSTREND